MRITLVLVAVAAVAFAGVAAAHCGSCGAGKDAGHAMHSCKARGDCPGWDGEATKSFEAKVVSFDKHECMGCKTTYTELVVEMEGKKMTVRLGPSWYIDNQDDLLEKGDVVKIWASKVAHGDEKMLVAGKIVKGDDVLVLRDKEGLPVWRGWRRGEA
jgi:hypothetical protein